MPEVKRRCFGAEVRMIYCCNNKRISSYKIWILFGSVWKGETQFKLQSHQKYSQAVMKIVSLKMSVVVLLLA